MQKLLSGTRRALREGAVGYLNKRFDDGGKAFKGQFEEILLEQSTE